MIPVGSSEQGLGTVFSAEDTVDGKSQIKGKVSGLSHQAVHSQITKSSLHATGRDRKQREAEWESKPVSLHAAMSHHDDNELASETVTTPIKCFPL